MNKGHSHVSHKPPTISKTSGVHVGRGPAVSPSYAHEQAVANRAASKAMHVKPGKSGW